jgi:hypothetical protein
MIKKNMLIALGIAGMFFAAPLADAQAGIGVNIRLGGRRHHHHYRHWHRRYRHSGLSVTTTAMKPV